MRGFYFDFLPFFGYYSQIAGRVVQRLGLRSPKPSIRVRILARPPSSNSTITVNQKTAFRRFFFTSFLLYAQYAFGKSYKT